MMGFIFKIKEIENGWIVTFFSAEGPIANDHEEYFDSIDKALPAIKEWITMIAQEEVRVGEGDNQGQTLDFV